MIKCRRKYLSSLQDETGEEIGTTASQDNQQNRAMIHGLRTKLMIIPCKLLFLGTFLSHINMIVGMHETDNTSSKLELACGRRKEEILAQRRN